MMVHLEGETKESKNEEKISKKRSKDTQVCSTGKMEEYESKNYESSPNRLEKEAAVK